MQSFWFFPLVKCFWFGELGTFPGLLHNWLSGLWGASLLPSAAFPFKLCELNYKEKRAVCDWSSLQGPVGCVTVTATPRMKAPVTLTPGTTTIRVAGSQVLTPAAKGATVVSTVSYTFKKFLYCWWSMNIVVLQCCTMAACEMEWNWHGVHWNTAVSWTELFRVRPVEM